MSKIEWTGKTWNPTTGCTKVSAGCKNCYAEIMHKRLKAMNTKGYEKPFNELVCHDYRLDIPLRNKKPTTYFVNSMSDLFHKDTPFKFIDGVFGVMKKTPQHTYQILTKRPEIMIEFLLSHNCWKNKDGTTQTGAVHMSHILSENIMLGVSVENKEQKSRIRLLSECPSYQYDYGQPCYKFLSIEPLLEDLGELDLSGIDWVIVGGESGHNARPMKKEWVLNIKKQCDAQDVPFFFKQWGAFGVDGIKRSKSKNGCLLNGIEYKETI